MHLAPGRPKCKFGATKSIAMQKVTFAQQQARERIEELKEQQRQTIAREAAKEIAQSKLSDAEKEARKQEQDALGRLSAPLNGTYLFWKLS